VVGDHAAAVEQAFSRQAAAFEDERFNRAYATGAEWIFERLVLDGRELLLDVAAGTAQAGRSLAGRVRTVVAVDATTAMLVEGRAAADAAGVRNIVFQRGDAAALPFLDGSFDVVVCRFAVHHFERPDRPIGEMIRCLRGGGQLVVADLVTSDDPTIARTHDRLERLRDPSHVRLLTPAGLQEAIAATGADVAALDVRSMRRPLAPWLEQTDADAAVVARIEDALRAELRGGPATGLQPSERDGALWFVQTFASVTATPAD
jgi:ubiquinone/menaquinone biosynthesis C-methylase UbiE